MRATHPRRSAQRGQAMVLLVLSLAVVIGGAAIVIDGGNGMSQQRGTQNASDAAALAGASCWSKSSAARRAPTAMSSTR